MHHNSTVHARRAPAHGSCTLGPSAVHIHGNIETRARGVRNKHESYIKNSRKPWFLAPSAPSAASGGVYIGRNTSGSPETISLLAAGAMFFGMLALRTQRVGVLRARVCEHGVAKNQNTPKMAPRRTPNPVPPLRLIPQLHNAHRAAPGVYAPAP